MAASRLNVLLIAPLLLAAAAGAADERPGPEAGKQVAGPAGIDLSADSIAYDGGTSRVDFRGLKISQNGMRITAGTATADALDFAHSEWKMHNGVTIAAGPAKIESADAKLTVRNNELATLELHGSPATFEQAAKGNVQPVKGGADLILLDNTKHTVSLRGNAWLRVGANEITGCDLVYDLAHETFSSGAGDCKQPVRIRVSPQPSGQKPAPNTEPVR